MKTVLLVVSFFLMLAGAAQAETEANFIGREYRRVHSGYCKASEIARGCHNRRPKVFFSACYCPVGKNLLTETDCATQSSCDEIPTELEDSF